MVSPLEELQGIARSMGRLCTDDYLGWVLWERTAYPFASWGATLEQFREYLSDPAEHERQYHEHHEW